MYVSLFLAAVLLFLNIYAYLLMRSDKNRAIKGESRVPEKKLLLIAACGGGVGIWRGMRKYRHKTKHYKFSLGVPAIMAVQGCLLAYGLYWLFCS